MGRAPRRRCIRYRTRAIQEGYPMGPLFSILAGVAGSVFRAARSAGQESAAQEANAEALDGARARSALDKAGAGSARGAFADHFRAQIAKATDSDGDGMISRSELEAQVSKGGGDAAAAGKLFKAMDKNGDGKVTADEFKDSIPVPPMSGAHQLIQMIQAHREAAGLNTNANNASSSQASPTGVARAGAIDASLVLARLSDQVKAAL